MVLHSFVKEKKKVLQYLSIQFIDIKNHKFLQ